MLVYLSGVILSFLISVISLTITDEEDCNINKPECFIASILLAIFSYATVIIQLGALYRYKYIKKG